MKLVQTDHETKNGCSGPCVNTIILVVVLAVALVVAVLAVAALAVAMILLLPLPLLVVEKMWTCKKGKMILIIFITNNRSQKAENRH